MFNINNSLSRVIDILDDDVKVAEVKNVPKDGSLTYENAFRSWVGAIFVDIRNSTALFNDRDDVKVSKMVRAFSSEIIGILDDDRSREIGIRGDCVYSIYTTPKRVDVYDLLLKSIYINTFLKELNELFLMRGYDNISAGIGLAIGKDLIVKAGKKGSGVNSKVWIGKAVTGASNLSALGAKNGVKPIVISEASYTNIMQYVGQSTALDFAFTRIYDRKCGCLYTSNLYYDKNGQLKG